MVFSPDADNVMLGTAAPSTHHGFDDELIGGTASDNVNPAAINEDLNSLDDILTQSRRGITAFCLQLSSN